MTTNLERLREIDLTINLSDEDKKIMQEEYKEWVASQKKDFVIRGKAQK